jgi:hypothetical protein
VTKCSDRDGKIQSHDRLIECSISQCTSWHATRCVQQVQVDLHFLDDDIAAVERRQNRLLMSKDRHCRRVCVESPSYDLNSHPGCESASTGEALAVWRGGQGGASTPPSEQDLYSAERLRMRNVAYTSVTKDLEKAGCSLEDYPSVDPRGESAGVRKIAKRRRVLAQVCFLLMLSFQMLVITVRLNSGQILLGFPNQTQKYLHSLFLWSL